ncbi:MAG: hypothetical protein JRH18_17755 [Deltaproteobacteria bacterium]|nr:hypothetical protein [Deltaproteobacteria bacterium]MBW1960788.1 hypothetical protein [Deltaproteobacteria bacterium]MBW1995010.1 hypothetical protein [Deltaproteobacteria bacterium]MBW2153503.1 hypothetical protein [Deltaproteobacteria bacterium]
MHDTRFRMLLDYLGLSWSGYREVRKGVRKRIAKHMQQLGSKDVESYIRLLDNDPKLKEQAEIMMSVSISRFFRDRKLWEVLKNRILPEFVIEKCNKITIWSAGCGCGQEVYSIKIVWTCLKQRIASLPLLEIVATDLNPAYLEKARGGIYSSSSLKEVTPEEKERFFKSITGKNSFCVVPELKEQILWKVHHLSSNPPGEQFQMIFLRNSVLTYYEEPKKTAILKKVINSLAPSGLFIIGSHEKLPPPTESALEPVPPFSYVFKKITASSE